MDMSSASDTGLPLSICNASANLDIDSEFLYLNNNFYLMILCKGKDTFYTTIAGTAIVQHEMHVYMHSVRQSTITSSLLYNINKLQNLQGLDP